MRRIAAVSLLTGLTAFACRSSDVPSGPNSSQPSLAVAPADQQLPGKYIVVYKPHVTDTRAEIARHVSSMTQKVERVYQYALRGWAGALSPAEVAQLRADPDVAFVEADGIVHTMTTQAPTPSWGLDRIDQNSLPLNNSYTYNRTGAGVHLYGIDTGILYSHNDFGGRASAGFDAITPGGNAVDCHGHGTHTASTAGGTTYGVAKGVTIIGVRVLDCTGSGTYSQVIAGVDWVTQNRILPAVANMSLGGPADAGLDAAINGSIAAGVVYAVASGNGDIFGNPLDACGFSPARVPAAITVNASTISDARASFSNYGTCTDIFAPGVNITAAWITNNSSTNTISGTSMATPHVAGAAALYLEANPTATPAQVATALTTNASLNKITNPIAGTPNRLLYIGFIGGGVGTNQPPVAKFTQTCPTNQCTFDASTSTDDVGIVSYAWNWGNGKSETKTNPVTKNTFTPGTYNVTLTVTDGGGLSNSVTKSVTVPTPTGNQSPTVNITAPTNLAVFLLGSSVSFSGTGNDAEDGALTGASLVWTSSIDGVIGTGTGFSLTTLSAGTHTITLTGKDSQNATGTATRTITINRPPTATITGPANNTHFAQGASAPFSGTGSDPEDGALTGGSLVWVSRTSGQIGTGTGFSTTTLPAGTHTIVLTATDSKGATGRDSITVVIDPPAGNQPPVAAFTFTCTGLAPHQCSFDASGSSDDVGIVQYIWNWGDGRTETRTKNSAKNTWSGTGTFNVTLTVKDAGGLTNSVTKAVAVP